MNKEQELRLINLQAGPEVVKMDGIELIALNKWIAYWIMGWFTKSDMPTSYYYDRKTGQRQGTIRNFNPSGEISDAMRLIPRLRKLGIVGAFELRLSAIQKSYQAIMMLESSPGEGRQAFDENPATAISMAAKSAMSFKTYSRPTQ